MFRSIVTAACLAGLGAGVLLTVLQQPTVAALIRVAESHERHAATSARAGAMSVMRAKGHAHPAGHPAAHSHRADPAADQGPGQHDSRDHRLEHRDAPAVWAPANGCERTFWSLLANVSAAIGFALLLCAVYTLLPGITVAHGGLWGLAGFVVFFANPALGLPPRLPGTLSADLFDRQLWWLVAVACSAAAVGLIAWRRQAWAWAAAALLLMLPHLLGAPQPAAGDGAVSPALARQFVWVTAGVNAAFWLTLGALSASCFRRLVLRRAPADVRSA